MTHVVDMSLDQWVGIPYTENEVNCWSLVRAFVFETLGKVYPEYFYDIDNLADDSEARIMEEYHNLGRRWKQVERPDIGDIIVLKIHGRPIHVGVYVGNGNFLHTMKGRQSTVERLDGWWSQQIFGYFKWIG